MRIRKRALPTGWYPETEREVQRQIESWENLPALQGRAVSVVVPHAGWYYSGALAWRGIRSLSPEAETIVVVGGHLRENSGIIAAPEEGYETPLGTLSADLELREYLKEVVGIREDNSADNTVEIQLPLVKAAFPQAKALWIRVAPSRESEKLGEQLVVAAEALDRKIAVIGSTDLTHYGVNYGFFPKGRGREAVTWVKETNDKRIISNLLSMNGKGALTVAALESSACSAGAAVCALEMARNMGARAGILIDYYTSYDIDPADSFVGYAAISYTV